MKGFFKRIKYFFDNVMSKGTVVMLAMLTFIMIVLVVIISGVILLAGFSEEEGLFYTVWEVLSTTVNAWMPSAEDGGIGYVLLIALSAIIGLFFTSFVIGIISSAIEDKLSQLRKGNSDIMEKGHMVVLGFDPGKYTLIQQLAMATAGSKGCIVVAEAMDKEEMEELLKDNLELKGIKLVCRNLDITDPVSLAKCSLETARLVVVNPIDDKRTVKTLLAVSSALEGKETAVKVATTVDGREYMLPRKTRENYGVTMLRTDMILSRIIAHSCTQSGLANAFFEVFNFEGNEFYVESYSGLAGKKWYELAVGMDGGVAVGLIRDGETYLNPDKDMEIAEGDSFIVFETSKGMSSPAIDMAQPEQQSYEEDVIATGRSVLIIGHNEKLELVLDELPGEVREISIIGDDLEDIDIINICNSRSIGVNMIYSADTADDTSAMEEILADISHVIILSHTMEDDKEADMKTIMQLLRLKDIRERLGYSFTITAEMKREDNRALIKDDGITDFIISSDMSSMVLTQIAVTPELYSTFHELLSNEGNEFQLKTVDYISGVENGMTVREIRQVMLAKNSIMLGIIDDENGIKLNPALDEKLYIQGDDRLIIIGEKPIVSFAPAPMG